MLVVVRRVRGLGDLPPSQAAYAAMLDSLGPAMLAVSHAAAVPPASAPMSPQMPAPSALDDAGYPIGAAVSTQGCPCAVAVLAHLTSSDAATQSMMLQTCAANPAGFFQQYAQAGGTDQMIADCAANGGQVADAWYRRPATWIIGGAVVLAGAIAIKVAL